MYLTTGCERHPPMSRTGTAAGSGGTVPRHHLAEAPTGQPHEILLSPLGTQPAVGHRVPEAVRVKVLNISGTNAGH